MTGFPAREIRLLMVTNERIEGTERGLRAEYGAMERAREIDAFAAVAPLPVLEAHGANGAMRAIQRATVSLQPNVVLVLSPGALAVDPDWITSWLSAAGNPVTLLWEGDAWHRWAKPPSAAMRSWLQRVDHVFTVAGAPQRELLERCGARDVRFVPQTYCHVTFAREEAAPPDEYGIRYDAVMIGNSVAHLGRFSRMPGAGRRARLARRLRSSEMEVAIYGAGWPTRWCAATVPYAGQASIIRQAKMSVNWDHFPRHHAYASDRLPISLIAGRPHITTHHDGLSWLPGEEAGLFFERSTAGIVDRVRLIRSMSPQTLLALGRAAHAWVSNRLSDRQAARFLLSAVDDDVLDRLPADPWLCFVTG